VIREVLSREDGYSLIELMIVVVLLGILVSVAVPQYFASVKNARAVQCTSNRGAIVRAVITYITQENIIPGATTPSIPDLIGEKLLNTQPVCTAGGVYFWLDPTVPEEDLPRIGCSVHWVP